MLYAIIKLATIEKTIYYCDLNRNVNRRKIYYAVAFFKLKGFQGLLINIWKENMNFNFRSECCP